MLETTIEFVNTIATELIDLNVEADFFSAEKLLEQKKYLHVSFKESDNNN